MKLKTVISVSDGNSCICQKSSVVFLKYCHTDCFCLMLHMIFNQLFNKYCTSIFIPQFDTRIVLCF